MTKKERALLAVQTLEEVYPQATCALQYEKPYELLIAVRLSAQCTDARVNQITPKLFAAYPTLESLAAADIGDLEEIVRPCGFYHMKARSIKEMSAQLLLHFESQACLGQGIGLVLFQDKCVVNLRHVVAGEFDIHHSADNLNDLSDTHGVILGIQIF